MATRARPTHPNDVGPVARRTIAAAAAAAVLPSTTGCLAGPPPRSVPLQSGAVQSGSTPSGSAPSGSVGSTGEASASGSSAASSLRTLDERTLRATFEDTARELLVPGAVMLLRTPQQDLTFTYGVTSLGGSTPVSAEDHVRIGSITKTWTGTVILQLVQEGKLRLTDPVARYRPDVPNGDAITIEQLLTMRSGLDNYSESYELNLALDTTPQRVWTPEELLSIGLSLPPYFAPGEGFHYSNTNTVLLGLIAEQLEGKPLARIIEDRVLMPLGLCPSPPSRRRTPRTCPRRTRRATCTWTTCSRCPRRGFRPT